MKGTGKIFSPDRAAALLGAFACALFALSAASCGGRAAPKQTPAPVQNQGPQESAPVQGQQLTQEQAAERQNEASLMADIGQVYLNHRRYEGAVTCFAKAIELTTGWNDNAAYHWGIADALKNLNRIQEAVANYKAAIDIFKEIEEKAKPETKEFYYDKLCRLNREIGNREEAISWAEKIAGDGTDPLAVWKLARLYTELGENSLAIDTYKMTLKKYGDVPEAMNVKVEYAEYLARSKQLQEARVIAEEVAAKAENKLVIAAAKRLLLQIYDGLGILDKVDIGKPPDENSAEKPKDGEDK